MTVPLIVRDDVTLGTMLVTGKAESALPLEETNVVAQITGPIASVSVTQHFANPFDRPVELLYLFPLPHEGAVVAFEIRSGNRVIKSRVEEAENARRLYADARDRHLRAALLEQRRPNLFSLEIANVQPHEKVVANIRYQQRVSFEDGEYTFVFPMGLTPRYHRSAAAAAQTDAPIAYGSERVGTVELQIGIDAGAPMGDPKSASHAVDVTRIDERRTQVRTIGENIPNKDFVLRYAVAEDDVRAAAWVAKGEGGAAAVVTAIPPRLDDDADPPAREFVFVVDRSGSMGGEPIAQAKNALRAALRSLGAEDTFHVIAFNDRVTSSAKGATAATQAAISAADRWLDSLRAEGGTEFAAALEAALALPADERRRRHIVFITDGAVSDEDGVLARLRGGLRAGRLFTFGIGPSVNRALLAEMALLGRGSVEFLQVDEDIEAALIRFQDRIGFPVLQDLSIEWRDARAWDVYPEQLPDLYSGQPLELAARVQVTGRDAAIVLSGRRRGEPWRLEISLPAASDEPAIARVWARARVDALNRQIDAEPAAAAKRHEVIALAMQHGLLTRYTSFVAIDETPTAGGEAMRVRVAVPLPEGLQREAFSIADAVPVLLSAPMMARSSPPAMSFALTGAGAAQPASMPVVIENRDPLRILARTQNASGSWGTGDGDVAATAEAVLAFIAAGYTTRRGSYRQHLRKAVRWLLAAAPKSAAIAALRDRALAAMAEATGDAIS